MVHLLLLDEPLTDNVEDLFRGRAMLRVLLVMENLDCLPDPDLVFDLGVFVIINLLHFDLCFQPPEKELDLSIFSRFHILYEFGLLGLGEVGTL